MLNVCLKMIICDFDQLRRIMNHRVTTAGFIAKCSLCETALSRISRESAGVILFTCAILLYQRNVSLLLQIERKTEISIDKSIHILIHISSRKINICENCVFLSLYLQYFKFDNVMLLLRKQ